MVLHISIRKSAIPIAVGTLLLAPPAQIPACGIPHRAPPRVMTSNRQSGRGGDPRAGSQRPRASSSAAGRPVPWLRRRSVRRHSRDVVAECPRRGSSSARRSRCRSRHHLPQPLPLRGDRLVPPPSHLRLDLLELGSHPVAEGLPLDQKRPRRLLPQTR